MESEHRIKDGSRWLWKQIGSRPNHFWDCESMQIVAAVMLKIIGREFSAADAPKDGTAEVED
jgi:hypothetical protein